MKSVYKFKETTWVDLAEPTTEELKQLTGEYSLDLSVVNELATPSMKQRVEARDHYLYAVLHFPAFKRTPNQSDSRESQEVDFIIGKNFIITAHYEQVDSIDRFMKKLEVDSILEKSTELSGRDFIYFGLLKEILHGIMHQLAFIGDWVKDVEANVFKGKEKDMVFSISLISRHLLDFKKITVPYKDAFKMLEQSGEKLFGESFKKATVALVDEFEKAEFILKNHMEVVAELRETNNSLLSTKQNEVMKVLTMMALFTFPLSLIASILALDTSYKPIIGQPNDFFLVVGLMLIVALLMYSFFRYKKWL